MTTKSIKWDIEIKATEPRSIYAPTICRPYCGVIGERLDALYRIANHLIAYFGYSATTRADILSENYDNSFAWHAGKNRAYIRLRDEDKRTIDLYEATIWDTNDGTRPTYLKEIND